MSFNPYTGNPWIPVAAETGVKWEWLYLESLEILPEQLGVNFRHVAKTLYHLIGPDPARVREALRLRELVERADEAGRGIEIDPPGDGYLIRLEPGEWIERASLPEAVEAALKELGDD